MGDEMKENQKRRMGLEQEFLLVDESGRPSERADELLARCAEAAPSEGLDPDDFSEECSRSMVEVKTAPAETLEELEEGYMANVGLAVRLGRELGLWLYPLATYPLPLTPSFREAPRYTLQIETIGSERFMDAGRCFGVHLHLEVGADIVDPVEVVSPDAPPAGVRELLDVYNLATALDPALIALTRSCPFYEGRATGLAARTAFYRGSAEFGWDGVYSELPELGGLQPYAEEAGDLIHRQKRGRETWREAMDSAGVGSEHLPEMSGGVLDICWRPVRLSPHGTVELRGLDSNFPDATFSVAALICAAAERLRNENLSIEPTEKLRRFESDGKRLFVPDFEGVGSELFFAAATEGPNHPMVAAYLDSIIEFAGEPTPEYINRLKNADGTYRTTEAEILDNFPPSDDSLVGEEEGLRLVREACDALEERVVVKESARTPAKNYERSASSYLF